MCQSLEDRKKHMHINSICMIGISCVAQCLQALLENAAKRVRASLLHPPLKCTNKCEKSFIISIVNKGAKILPDLFMNVLGLLLLFQRNKKRAYAMKQLSMCRLISLFLSQNFPGFNGWDAVGKRRMSL